MDSWLIVFVCISGVLIGVVAGRFWEKRSYKRKVQKLNATLDKIMHGNLSPDWSAYEEGELSILANQLELLVKRTSYMVERLNGEKAAIHDFVADISHQIKTPLTGLLTYLDLWESMETDASKQKQIAECIYLVERINELIRTLLELAKLDSGSVQLRIEDMDAKEVLHEAVQTALAARPGMDRSFHFDIKEEFSIRCDRKWFVQALVNIFVNALDYSKDGTAVQVSAQKAGSVILIKVLDHGGGISEADLKHIFKRFYRTKNARKDGFGIGLSMAEGIIHLHKGDIRAVNEGDGLAMYITLPILPCAEAYTENNLTNNLTTS